jgi:hypothetical protein
LKDFDSAIYVFKLLDYSVEDDLNFLSFFLKKDYSTDEKPATDGVYAASHDSQPKVPKRFSKNGVVFEIHTLDP